MLSHFQYWLRLFKSALKGGFDEFSLKDVLPDTADIIDFNHPQIGVLFLKDSLILTVEVTNVAKQR